VVLFLPWPIGELFGKFDHLAGSTFNLENVDDAPLFVGSALHNIQITVLPIEGRSANQIPLLTLMVITGIE
jgi:hypothetical protein